MDIEKEIISLENKNQRLENKCENIFDQLTELRTVIQEIYSDSSKSERFLCQEMLKISKRLEDMAKSINSSNTTHLNFSPHVNPKITQSPTIISDNSEKIPSVEDSNKKDFFKFDLKKIVTIGVSAIVGFIVIVGLVSMFVFKLIDIFGSLLN